MSQQSSWKRVFFEMPNEEKKKELRWHTWPGQTLPHFFSRRSIARAFLQGKTDCHSWITGHPRPRRLYLQTKSTLVQREIAWVLSLESWVLKTAIRARWRHPGVKNVHFFQLEECLLKLFNLMKVKHQLLQFVYWMNPQGFISFF